MNKKESCVEQVKDDGILSDPKWPETTVELTDHNFNAYVNKFQLLVVDFWAPWCMPCKMVAPVIEELAKDYRGKVVFGKMNVDKEKKIGGKYGILSIPTIYIFKNGKIVDQQIGAMPKEILRSIINRHL